MAFTTKGALNKSYGDHWLPDILTLKIVCGVALLLALSPVSTGAAGLSTRDQNPMFQAYYLPTNSPQTQDGWNFSHSVFITNTFQTQAKGNEILVIDAENYRYDLSIAYQHKAWRASATIPFFSTRSGMLDSFIEDWHDFFGFPQNGRNLVPNDQLNISYTQNGEVIYQQLRSSDGLGDIALSLSYALAGDDKGATEISFTVDLPAGSSADNTGNDVTDLALWLRKTRAVTTQSSLFGLIGMSRLGKGGQLADRLERQVWVAQFGLDHAFNSTVSGILQLDMHSRMVKNSALTALGNSIQVQLGLTFKQLLENHDLSLFFSEDILVGSAPDITFGLQLSRRY
ncbi:MAG: DUF3187 family protein [Proteobacteria bacterium]|nr:DUF3187 family protein [Pseudomonadota bacterium]